MMQVTDTVKVVPPTVLLMQMRDWILFFIALFSAISGFFYGCYRLYKALVKAFDEAVIHTVKPWVEDLIKGLTDAISQGHALHESVLQDVNYRLVAHDEALERHGKQLDDQADEIIDINTRMALLENGVARVQGPVVP